MKVAVHLPDFIPWAGFWAKYMASDTFIFAVGTRYNPTTYFNRVTIAGRRVAVPVVSAGKGVSAADMRYYGESLCRVIALVRGTIRPSRYGDRLDGVCEVLEEAAKQESGSMVELNLKLISHVAYLLGAEAKVIIDKQRQRGASVEDKVFDVVSRNVEQGVYLPGLNSAVKCIPPSLLHRFALCHPQQVHPIYPGTVLQIIARERDPVDAIQSAFRWTTEPAYA